MVASGKAVGYFAHDGGISRTLDGYAGLTTGSCTGTNQFDSLSQSLGSMTEFVSVSVHPTNADILLGGTQDNGSPKTSSATSSSTWQNALGGDGGFNAINPTNPSEWFAANPYVTILKCELGTACNDSGFSEVVSSANLGGDQGAFYTPYMLDPQNTSEMLVGTCRVWRVSTSGTAPLELSNDFDTLGTGVCTGDEINLVDRLAAGGPKDTNNNSTVVYAVTNGYGPLSGLPGGEVWVTTNAGVTLMANVTQNVNPNGYAISSVAMDKSDATGTTAYVGIMGFSTPGFPTPHVWKTANAGASWTDWTGTGLPDAPVNALLVDSSVTPAQIYAGTDVGVFVSSTTAASWTEVGPAPGPGVSGFLPDAPVTALQMFHPDAGTKTLVASTYGRGIWNYALVTSADYTNVISNSPQTVFPAQTATFNGTLTAKSGYASPVNLSCTGASADDLHAAADARNAHCDLHADCGRHSRRLQLQCARGGDGWKRDYARCLGHAACGGLQSDRTQSEFDERRAGRNVHAEQHVSGDRGGKFCGDGDAQLLGGAARGSGLRILTIEFGESDFFCAGDGCTGGDGGDWDSAGWAEDCDRDGDGGGSAFAQDADILVDGDRAGPGLCHRGDRNSERNGGRSECDVERNADGGERIQRQRDVDMYGGRSGDVRNCSGNGHAGVWRNGVRGHARQRDDWGV